MKIYARIENESGKIDGMGGNEYLDIDITVGNQRMVSLTVRQDNFGHFRIYNENDTDVTDELQGLENR